MHIKVYRHFVKKKKFKPPYRGSCKSNGRQTICQSIQDELLSNPLQWGTIVTEYPYIKGYMGTLHHKKKYIQPF